MGIYCQKGISKMGNIILRQTLVEPINGYWDGGPKKTFDWKIEHNHRGKDHKGEFIRVGSWSANHWFHVALGKTDKQTLSNAKRRLLAMAKRSGMECKFEYIEEVK